MRESPDRVNYGDRLRLAILVRRLSKAQAASEAGISRNTLDRLLAGHTRPTERTEQALLLVLAAHPADPALTAAAQELAS